MKSISLRGVPDDIYEGLQAMAKGNRRSLQEQIKSILEYEVRLRKGAVLRRARDWRKRLEGREHSSTVGLVREDRAR